MLSTSSFGSRPLSAGPRVPRAFRAAATAGEYGFAAWSYSRQAKLNAWGWHGLGALGDVNSWATLGNVIYVRGENDSYMRALQPDVFLSESDTNTESTSVEATTQWLDFGKPGKRKSLTGLDFDGQNVERVEVYVSVDGDREGTLAATLELADANGGWTYNGELLPLELDGTEFKLRFVCDGNLEAQVNRLTIYYDEVGN